MAKEIVNPTEEVGRISIADVQWRKIHLWWNDLLAKGTIGEASRWITETGQGILPITSSVLISEKDESGRVYFALDGGSEELLYVTEGRRGDTQTPLFTGDPRVVPGIPRSLIKHLADHIDSGAAIQRIKHQL